MPIYAIGVIVGDKHSDTSPDNQSCRGYIRPIVGYLPTMSQWPLSAITVLIRHRVAPRRVMTHLVSRCVRKTCDK